MVTKSYHDLCAEIDILQLRIQELEAEFSMWERRMGGVGRKPIAPLDIVMDRMKEICDLVETYSIVLEKKERTRRQIEERMADIDKLENKVAYMRDVECKSLAEIAVDLGYSYDWIKKLSARTSRLKNGA